MAQYSWPKRGTASLIGTAQDRIDGLAKATGMAKYAYDINAPQMLFGKLLGSPHAHCRIKSIDTSAAEKVRGVKAVKTMKEPGNEIRWQGDHIACVAAESEGAAAEGVAAIKVDYELLDVFVNEEDLEAAEKAGRAQPLKPDIKTPNEPGDDDDEDEFYNNEFDRLFSEAAVVVEGYYGVPVISHMCLEPHGSTCQWTSDKLLAHLSTQNVSGTASQFGDPLGITADDVTVHCDYIGGGFGSKFAADAWGVIAAQITKETGRPVKLMLDRDLELKIAGIRPSGFIKVKAGADSEGKVTIWDSRHWGTAGPGAPGNVGHGIIPYVFNPPSIRRQQIPILTDTGPHRAWRAPGHPQACAMSQTAYDDVAAKLGIDSYDVFLRNLSTVTNGKEDVYRDQMEIAARLIDWKAKWHP
ncbi:MAG: molybdopterin cofactor-binding domain-containing protein, partial [Pirellulales bacterium]